MKLSVVIPVFNERRTIEKILALVEQVALPSVEREIIVVDDFSTDGTRELLKNYESRFKVVYQDRNQGKGAALRRGFMEATGDYIINQDADLEYDPADHATLVAALLEKKAEVVFGSRRLDGSRNGYVYKRYLWGGILVNSLVNMIGGVRVNDIFSGTKLFPRSALERISLQSQGFEIETELTIKLARAGYRIVEVPISYKARTIEEGKKIRPRHAINILVTAFKSRWQ